MTLIIPTKKGLFCPQGGFYIDPWEPVPLAIITHGHGDHAFPGCEKYICSELSKEILEYRLGSQAQIEALPYGQKKKIENVWISLHSAGHILGSAQVRIEKESAIVVASGDYKRAYDSTCDPFEILKCDEFITESTFALPIFHWPSSEEIGKEIAAWWKQNAEENAASVLFCYSLGKAQRILSLLQSYTDQPVYVHGAIIPFFNCYYKRGKPMLPIIPVSQTLKGKDFSKDLILAPPSAFRSSWMKRFNPCRTAYASGWMAMRGTRRRMGFERGFVLSDHADWNDLLRTIEETGAKKVYSIHGFNDLLSKYLQEIRGIESEPWMSFLIDEE